ncbi:protein-tyrosine phosphatase family protein [Chondromyces crocatus]|uniref:Protein phosphatase n=1 Tax=Chondromyces crocatus TaxID=52 RepID=A0A0K1EJ11_CHOCO|nr:dual specificity protein phosphatase family protein [Chondromyces crocatus]AKT40861.1 uncharacterized protein CMC5_050160 [Chondromyces crocatus]
MPLPPSLRTALFTPYRLVFYPMIIARRAAAAVRPGADWRTWITPHLLLGGFLFPSDVEVLQRLGIGAVINVSHELIDPVMALRAAGIAYHHVACWDMSTPTLEDCDTGVRFLANRIERGERVYVHCASGVGRSVVLSACYLAIHDGMPVDEVLDRLQRLRPRIKLRPFQRAFIHEYVAWRRDRDAAAAVASPAAAPASAAATATASAATAPVTTSPAVVAAATTVGAAAEPLAEPTVLADG